MKVQVIRVISTNSTARPNTLDILNKLLYQTNSFNFDTFTKQLKDSSHSLITYSPQYIIKSDNISFGYKSVLKTEWLNGNMPTVKKGIYGGILTPKNVTLEHIIPSSKGGKTELYNLALAVNINNWQRSSRPFKYFFDPETLNEYLEQFKDIDLPNFKGLNYIEGITKVIKKVLRDENYDFSNIPFLK